METNLKGLRRSEESVESIAVSERRKNVAEAHLFPDSPAPPATPKSVENSLSRLLTDRAAVVRGDPLLS